MPRGKHARAGARAGADDQAASATKMRSDNRARNLYLLAERERLLADFCTTNDEDDDDRTASVDARHRANWRRSVLQRLGRGDDDDEHNAGDKTCCTIIN